MSTITSPRAPSVAPSLTTPTTSRRQSLDSQANSPSPHRRPSHNSNPSTHALPRPRNRLALRDYYNLHPTTTSVTSTTTLIPGPTSSTTSTTASHLTSPNQDDIPSSALDALDFSAPAYVTHILENESLRGLLQAEGRAVNEIRALDAARKALVYDNYSKLIAATETIRNMRRDMDPLQAGVATGTAPALGPGVVGESMEHIVGVAEKLAGGWEEGNRGRKTDMTGKKRRKEIEERQMVRWVVDAPDRLKGMVKKGEVEAAEKDWKMVYKCLEVWESKGVKGSSEVREKCVGIMNLERFVKD